TVAEVNYSCLNTLTCLRCEYQTGSLLLADTDAEEVYWEKVKNAAKAEIALRRVLKDENAVAFTTNFDDLGD
ncbi:hypothetical protein JVV93_21345, partial [Vibrio cholerae O1]